MLWHHLVIGYFGIAAESWRLRHFGFPSLAWTGGASCNGPPALSTRNARAAATRPRISLRRHADEGRCPSLEQEQDRRLDDVDRWVALPSFGSLDLSLVSDRCLSGGADAQCGSTQYPSWQLAYIGNFDSYTMIESVYDFKAIHKRLRELGGGLDVARSQEEKTTELSIHGSPLEKCIACSSQEHYQP